MFMPGIHIMLILLDQRSASFLHQEDLPPFPKKLRPWKISVFFFFLSGRRRTYLEVSTKEKNVRPNLRNVAHALPKHVLGSPRYERHKSAQQPNSGTTDYHENDSQHKHPGANL